MKWLTVRFLNNKNTNSLLKKYKDPPSDFTWKIKDIPEDDLRKSLKLVKDRGIGTIDSPIAVVEMAIAATPPPSYLYSCKDEKGVLRQHWEPWRTYSVVQKDRQTFIYNLEFHGSQYISLNRQKRTDDIAEQENLFSHQWVFYINQTHQMNHDCGTLTTSTQCRPSRNKFKTI